MKDAAVETDKEIKRNERILEEGRKLGYNVFRLNDETRKICLANEKKTPIRWPDDHDAYIDKLFGIR